MRLSELDRIEQSILKDYKLVVLKHKLTTHIEQCQPVTDDRYSKGFVDGLKYALSLITQ